MKKIIYLHIGVHKTGSSSIQSTLFKSRKELSLHGYHYFSLDYDGKTRGLPRGWVNSADFNNIFVESPKKLNKELKKVKERHIIISIEDFSWFLTEQSFTSIKEAFEGFHVKVIGYIRRQDRQLISYMQEGSKSKHKPSIRYYGKTLLALPSSSMDNLNYLNYEERYLNWSKYFGRDNVDFRGFEKATQKFGDVVYDFCDSINLPLKVKAIRANESLDFINTKLGNIINECDMQNSDLEFYLRKNITAMNKDKLLPGKLEALNFYKQFEQQNERLRKLICPNDKYLFDDDFSSYPDLASDTWTEDKANFAIKELLRMFENYVKEKAMLNH